MGCPFQYSLNLRYATLTLKDQGCPSQHATRDVRTSLGSSISLRSLVYLSSEHRKSSVPGLWRQVSQTRGGSLDVQSSLLSSFGRGGNCISGNPAKLSWVESSCERTGFDLYIEPDNGARHQTLNTWKQSTFENRPHRHK